MEKYSERNVIVYSLPIPDSVSILHPENVLLKFTGTNLSIDIGSFCYLKRSLVDRKREASTKVDLASLSEDRVRKIRELIGFLSSEVSFGDKRVGTVFKWARYFFVFINWCDLNGHENVLSSESYARKALIEYSSSLVARVNKNDLNVNSAALMQRDSAEILAKLFTADDILRGIKKIYKSSSENNETTPPHEADQARVLALCNALFEGACSLVLDFKSYPFKMKMPEYLNFNDNSLWFFASTISFMAPHDIQDLERSGRRYKNWAYDYASGRNMTLDEIVDKYPSRQHAHQAILSAENTQSDANLDRRNINRIKMAMMGMQAFLVLFVANTGMNPTQIAELIWSDEYELDVDRQNFRSIKYRANGKEVNITIESTFVKYFKKYIELRKYIAFGEVKSEYLFFTLGNNLTETIGRKINVTGIMTRFYNTLERIDPSIPRIMPRQWRAAKSDWAVSGENVDTKVGAEFMQNSEDVFIKHYITGSDNKAAVEFGVFFERLIDVVKLNSTAGQTRHIISSVGNCGVENSPISVDPSSMIQPDCKKPDGCLFCDKYFVHADEIDVKKLISYKLCINSTRHLSESIEHFNVQFGETIRIIDAIVEYVSSLSEDKKAMVEMVKVDVEENGNIDNYWKRKLEMLINIGVVSHASL